MGEMKVVPIRFGLEEYERLRRQSFDEKRSMAEIVREALGLYWKGDNKVRNLQELTGQESGIVIYGGEGILCNWSSIDGLPRIFATGLIGMGEDIPVVEGERVDDLTGVFEGVDVNIYAKYDDEGLPQSGTVYKIGDDIIVVAPDDWV